MMPAAGAKFFAFLLVLYVFFHPWKLSRLSEYVLEITKIFWAYRPRFSKFWSECLITGQTPKNPLITRISRRGGGGVYPPLPSKIEDFLNYQYEVHIRNHQVHQTYDYDLMADDLYGRNWIWRGMFFMTYMADDLYGRFEKSWKFAVFMDYMAGFFCRVSGISPRK